MARSQLDYELIDFGDGRKLERFGNIILNRPEILAKGSPKMGFSNWENLQTAIYDEKLKPANPWRVLASEIPKNWGCRYPEESLSFLIHLGKYKHVGLFPEQEANWNFISKYTEHGMRFLNLFGYTGAASLVAAKQGADVYHVDASKSIMKLARENASKNSIGNIHWVCDDALKFSQREIKRGNFYDFIMMDPPVFGISRKGERWQLEKSFGNLIEVGKNLLVKGGVLVVNTYSPRLSLQDMERVAQEFGLKCTKSGWLSVHTKHNASLELSKFIYCKKE